MISNERQYRITKAQVAKFEAAIEGLEPADDRSSSQLLRRVSEESLRSQADELTAQIQEYEALRDGKSVILEANSLAEFPRALIQARIASGLSQKRLADCLSLKEQQIQRYESSGYRSASLSRVQSIVQALGVSVHLQVVMPLQVNAYPRPKETPDGGDRAQVAALTSRAAAAARLTSPAAAAARLKRSGTMRAKMTRNWGKSVQSREKDASGVEHAQV